FDAGLPVPTLRGHRGCGIPAQDGKGCGVSLLAGEGGGMTVGDYDLRGRDYETELVGPITDAIIDADRLARAEHRNGFPNFALYRLVMCGDRAYLKHVRHWWVLFAIEWCRNRMRGSFSEELATIAAWDSLQRVMDPARPILSGPEVAESLGVHCRDYVRVRD